MKKSSFIEGTVIATVAIVLVKILGMLYVIPFYATIGVQGAALYAYAYNIYIIFLDISTAGIPTAMSKIISEYDTLGMKDAKVRAYKLGLMFLTFISIAAFIVLFLFARPIATIIIGDLTGGNTIADVAFAIRMVSFALLVIPFLSVTKGYLQGHHIINVTGVAEVIEQVVRIIVILGGSYIALNVLHLSLKTAVGIAVFGAFVGGLVALTYVLKKVRNNWTSLDFGIEHKKDPITNKAIFKKIISYAVPFIIISTAMNIYNFIDMVFILRTLKHLNYSALEVEFVSSALATWSAKLNMIVTSISMGMTISLIPTIVSAFAKKDWKDVEEKFNKALQIIFLTTVPMVVGLSMLAEPVWSVFYGYNPLGTSALKISVFIAFFQSVFMITNSTLQGLNKFKTVYLSAILGFVTNAVLDIPMMLLCNALGIHAFHGATIASCIGYSVSIYIALQTLRREHGIHFKSSIKLLLRTIVPTLAMILVLCFVRCIFPYDPTNKFICILFIGVSTILGGATYLFLTFQFRMIYKVFGKEYVNKILKKLTLGKFHGKD